MTTDMKENLPTNERESDVCCESYSKQDLFKYVGSRGYSNQFYSMYQYRLSILKERVDKIAMLKWGDGEQKVDGKVIVKKKKILDINSDELCWVSGTIYSDMKNKLNILRDVENGVDDVIPALPESYLPEDETIILMLEDESGRAILGNSELLQSNLVVTGCIVAILGIEIEAGVFQPMDILFPEPSPQKALSPPSNEGKKIAFVSGLRIQDDANYDLKLELLQAYITGMIGTQKSTKYVSQITRLVIVGDSIIPEERAENLDFFSTNNYGSKNTSKYGSKSLKLFDRFISNIIPSISVSIMPGKHDISDICLPQQTLHKALFNSSRNYVGTRSLTALTNPSWIELDYRNIRMLGTSGQNVNDILKYLDHKLRQSQGTILSIMEASMQWQNIAPTAPDTLYCYPFENFDPFTLSDETPHVYFVGNQKSFAASKMSLQPTNSDTPFEITLVSIPTFSETGQLVVLDLDTLTCESITLGI